MVTISEDLHQASAITEAIRICKNQNVLKEYLNSREKEVVDIMITMSASDENACLHAFEGAKRQWRLLSTDRSGTKTANVDHERSS